MGEGDHDYAYPNMHKHTELNSAGKIKIKKSSSGMRATALQKRDARTGIRKQHTESSRLYQEHLRDVFFPRCTGSKRAKLHCTPSSNNELGVSPSDFEGLRQPYFVAITTQANVRHAILTKRICADPSEQRDQRPKKARCDLVPLNSPPCKGSCLKHGWTIDQYCPFCHG